MRALLSGLKLLCDYIGESIIRSAQLNANSIGCGKELRRERWSWVFKVPFFGSRGIPFLNTISFIATVLSMRLLCNEPLEIVSSSSSSALFQEGHQVQLFVLSAWIHIIASCINELWRLPQTWFLACRRSPLMEGHVAKKARISPPSVGLHGVQHTPPEHLVVHGLDYGNLPPAGYTLPMRQI